MTVQRSVVGIALLLSTLVSCDKSSPTEQSAAPRIPGTSTPAVRMMPKLSAVTAMTTAPARHNPRSQSAYQVTCFEGETDSPGGGFLGICQKFSPTGDGAEINTRVQGPSGSYAGVTQVPNYIRGRLLKDVVNLNFSYAGGPHQGGVPRLSIPIDHDANGSWDSFAFMDAPGCNDGDEFVGRVEGRADNTCLVSNQGVDYPNWTAFRTANSTYRIATNAVTFIIVDQAAHYLIWRVQIN